MPFLRLNKDDAGLADNVQAQFDSTDFWSLVPRNPGDGVLEGLAPTSAGVDMEIDLATGWVQQSQVAVQISAGAATIGTADGSNPRIDIIVIDTSTPSITVRAGTPAAAPESPTLTAGDIPIAEIFVAAGDAALASDTITDLRHPTLLAFQTAEFTSDGTWTKPPQAAFITVWAQGAGGSGASGRRGAAGTDRYGGGGGGSGLLAVASFLASALGSTETVTIGTGGTGGAARTTNDTDGENGQSGGSGTVSFGSHLRAANGGVGGGGTATSGISGSPSKTGQFTPNPTLGNQQDADLSAAAPGNLAGNAGYGGPGGGIPSSDAHIGVGAWGGAGLEASGGNALGGLGADGSGTAGGGGGGGGTWAAGATFKDGGAGGVPGGGGGGGAASVNGNDSGAGGNGGRGVVYVLTW